MIAAAEFPRPAGMPLLDRLAQMGVPLADLTADSRAVKMGSIFVAYPERLAEKPEAYRELLRMLKASSDYTLAHQDEVFTAVAESTKVPKEFFVDWWANYGSFPVAISNGDIKAIETVYAKAKDFSMSSKPADLKQAIWDKALRE